MQPDAPPAAAPAHWSPQRLATTILIEGGVETFAELLPPHTETLATFDDGDAQHLILSCRNIRLRVCITAAPGRTEPAFVVPANSLAVHRLEAARQFTALQIGNLKAFTRPPFTPTRYDRARLARLLAVADAGAVGASARDIAFEVVFPHSTPLVGDDWRDSSEQRQTRRLIAQAARMIDGGFWRLPCFA